MVRGEGVLIERWKVLEEDVGSTEKLLEDVEKS